MLKEFLLPPGSLILASLALLFLFRRRPGAGRAILLAATACLYLLSTPYVASLLIRSLQWYPPIVPGGGPPAEAIVVLSAGRDRHVPMFGGDTIDSLSLERLRFAARLQRASGLPLLVSGGPPPRPGGLPMAALMAEALAQDFGLETRWREEASTNTAENALLSARLLAEVPIRKVYVVTHAWHLPRAMMAFRATGLEAIPAPSSHAVSQRVTAEALLPNARALSDSAYALHEWIGMGWYAASYGFRPARRPDGPAG
ncbi:YdcF family protein [Roseococcus sp. SYP-B2431]|uniref:YdcF family protein n=1 Tax=Roseococcus sp. SYP-B2431 TaxID=2496640 RepID=UPI001040AE0D|nr:YdcF family protein [Roseococcus sp. SYP-B2431]TCH98257.1 YdcF family protein [Roseococcus sp. SYP-B2431]